MRQDKIFNVKTTRDKQAFLYILYGFPDLVNPNPLKNDLLTPFDLAFEAIFLYTFILQ